MKPVVRSRGGVTLIELLVVIAVIAIVIGLAAMGVVKVRSAAARAACADQLRQVGSACHGAESVHRRMPPAFGFFPYGSDIVNGGNGLGNLFFHLLPHLQEDTLYKQSRYLRTRPRQDFYFYTANGVHQTLVSLFQCPSDPTLMPGVNPATNYAPSSYAANYLVFANVDANYLSKNAQGKPTKMTFRDGASQTVLLAEKYASAWWAPGNAAPSPPTPLPRRGEERMVGGCNWAYFQADCNNPFFAYVEPARRNVKWPLDPGAIGTATTFQVQPTAAGGTNPCLPATGHAAMNVGMADGSVRSLSAGMAPGVWWALVTPAGGEALPGDW
ncbi:MAG: DUF1559 domain-containing protein [Planctomycetes bacterium]|nr:DUF1559 domain-containing protein [Planctomycetota bacterium]